ncbi:IS3 family transposase [Streptomyces scopuliridis]
MTALVDEHPHLGVEPVLRELNIPSSTHYRWRQAGKEPCERRRRDAELTGRIRQVHDESGGIYGSPRVHADLKREGVHVGRKRVERLMREAGMAGLHPVAPPDIGGFTGRTMAWRSAVLTRSTAARTGLTKNPRSRRLGSVSR